MVRSLEGKVYKKLLRSLSLPSPNELRGGPMVAAALTGSKGEALSSAICDNNRTQRAGMELCQRRSRLDIRKRFFIKGWWARNRLPRTVVTASILTVREAFRQCSQT